MNQVVMFNNKTAGRDNLARLIQYASQLTWHLLQKCNASGNSVNKIKDLEYILNNFRKLLRFGRCFDTLYSAMCMIHNEDVLVSVNCAISKVSLSMYLLCDHIIWLGRCGFADVDTNCWGRISSKYWLLSIIINLVRDYMEIRRLLASSKVPLKYSYNNPKLLFKNSVAFAEAHKDVVLDTVKNCCDVFLPLAALNYINLSPGLVGLLGVVSSAAGMYSIIDPYAKLPLS